MASIDRLSDLKPEHGSAQIIGFHSQGAMSDLLMAFGLLPGLSVRCESLVPLSDSQIFRFQTPLESWRGALRHDEAQVVRIRLHAPESGETKTR